MVLIKLETTSGDKVWAGQHDHLPAVNDLVALLSCCKDPDLSLLQDAVRMILQYCEPSDAKSYLNWLICLRWTDGGTTAPNPNRLRELGNTNAQRLCGYVFQRGDIAWNCRQCQKDATCVQCDDCFRRADHTGHDVTFHKTAPGGCCDCGDLEAWEEEGCCTAHAGTQEDNEADDPVSRLPPELQQSAAVVLGLALDFMIACAQQTMWGYERSEVNKILQDENNTQPYVVRVHNDDIHTFQLVLNTFTQQLHMNLQDAMNLTQKIDEEGEARIYTGADAEEARTIFDTLSDRDLLVSCQLIDHLKREKRCEAVVEWISGLCQASDGLCRLVAQSLVRPEHEVPTSAPRFKKEACKCSWNCSFLQLQEMPDLETGEWKLITTYSNLISTKLNLLIMLDPLYTKNTRSAMHALYMNLLVDANFKKEFAWAFTLCYSFLNRLYCKGIGTQEDTIFGFSVQIFTTASLVKVFCEGPFDLLKVLLECLLDSLRLAGCGEDDQPTDAFLESDVCNHRRFAHIFRDLEYIFQAGPVASDILCQPQDDEMKCEEDAAEQANDNLHLGLLFEILHLLQYMDEATRATGAHVEYESRRWMASYGLSFSISSLAEAILDSAMKPDDAWGANSPQGPRKIPPEVAANVLASASFSALDNWLNKKAGTYLFKEAPALLQVKPPPPLKIAKHVDFKVHLEPVSLHAPLQRFLARAWMVACRWGLQMPNPNPRSKPCTRLAILEHPLRATVFHSQVLVGMWKRNGNAVQAQAVNYSGIPLCKHMRDLDLVAMQLSAIFLGAESFMLSVLNRFNLEKWLLQPDFVSEPEADGSELPKVFCLPMAEECLKFLIILVTELPKPPGSESLRIQVRRELVHRLAYSQSTHSEVTSAASLTELGDLGTSAVEHALKLVSTVKQGSAPALFDLKEECCLEYDPLFFHLGKQEHEAAMERVVAKRNLLKKKHVGPLPPVPPPPIAHADFTAVRELLYSPATSLIIYNALRNLLKEKKSSEILASRAIHLLLLQIHGLKQEAEVLASALGDVSAFFNQLRIPQPEAGEDGMGLLEVMVEVVQREGAGSTLSPLYLDGLIWALQEIANLDSVCNQMLHKLEYFKDSETEAGAVAKESLAERKKRAQKKAMEAMKKRQVAFAQHLVDIEDEEEGVEQTKEEELSAETGVSDCIMCHERTGQPMGYISFCQASSTLSKAVLSSGKVEGCPTHIVVGRTGCQVRSEVGLDSEPVTHLPQNQQVTVVQQVGRRVQLTHPVKGWCSVRSDAGYVILRPHSHWAFAKWGQNRPFVTSCGHAVHLDCWDTYFASILQRVETHSLFDGRMSVDVKKAEFLCPLCKSISNLLIPHIPTHMQLWRKSLDSQGDQRMVTSIPEECTAWESLIEWAIGPSTAEDTFQSMARKSSAPVVPDPREGEEPHPPQAMPVLCVRRLMEGIQQTVGGGIGNYSRGNALREVHLLWVSLANMLSTSELVTRSLDDALNLGSFEDVMDMSLANRLFLSSEHALCSLSDNGIGMDRFSDRIAQILSGDSLNSTPANIAFARKMPLQVIIGDNCLTAKSRLKHLRAVVVNGMDFHFAELFDNGDRNTPIDVAWPVLSQPLLTWDMTVLATGLATISRCKSGVRNSVIFASFARLLQILLQPSVCLHGSSSKENNVDDIIGSTLQRIRGRLADAAGIEISNGAPQGLALVQKVYDIWIPFLRSMILLQQASDWFTDSAESHREAFASSSIEDLWTVLGIPHLIKIVNDQKTMDLVKRWGEQYASFHRDIDVKPAAEAKTSNDHSCNTNDTAKSTDSPKQTGLSDQEEKTSAEELEGVEIADNVAEGSDTDVIQDMVAAVEVAENEAGTLDDFEEPLSEGLDDEIERIDRTVFTADPYNFEDDEKKSAVSDSNTALEIDSVPLSYMSTFTGSHTLPSIDGKSLEQNLYDLSHMSVSKHETVGLVELPAKFTELYSQVKNPYCAWAVPDFEPALCLICGEVIAAGNHVGPKGDCTKHATTCSAGIGIFFLVQKCSVLLIRNSKAAYYPSLYVDEYGEEDMGLKRGKPLFLSQYRYNRLKELYLKHQIAQEVTKIRCSVDRIIRDDYY